ncbi:hypothetical protein GCM10027610_070850 [Dactylosporangium cerinum]
MSPTDPLFRNSRVGLLRRMFEPDPDREGYAVRIDWPTVGAGPTSHDFVQFTADLSRAWRRAARTRRFWRRGPVRPLAVTVAPMAWSVFAVHRQGCSSLGCPTAAPLYGMSGGDGVCARQQA